MRCTPEEIQEMRDMRAAGKTIEEIAEWIGCATRTVRYHVERLDVTKLARKRDRSAPRGRLSAEMIAHVQKLHADGMTYDQVAEAAGVSRNTICYWLKSEEAREIQRQKAREKWRANYVPAHLRSESEHHGST